MHLARRFLVPSPVSYALKSSTLFVLTKHVNGVALNTRVVNHNFRNALTLHYNFWGYFTSSSNLFYERWIYCFSTHSHRGFKPAQFECILRAMQCVLSALCAKVEVAENNACGRTTASQLYNWSFLFIVLHKPTLLPSTFNKYTDGDFWRRMFLSFRDVPIVPWCSWQQSRHLFYYMAPHCLARLLHKIHINFFQRGFSLTWSCAQCNAYLLYCVRNNQPARDQGRSSRSTCSSLKR